MSEGPKTAIRANFCWAGDHGEWVDDGVMADHSPTVDVRVPRVDNRHSFGHPVILNSCLHYRTGLRQMLARVDPEHVVRVQYVERQNLSAHVLQVFRSVGQVVLALGVAGTNLVESVPESGQLENVTARVDLFQGAFLGRAVAFLDDTEKSSGRVAKDSAETGGIPEHRRSQQAGRLVAMLAIQQVGQGLGPQERFVANQDERGAFVVSKERATTLCRMPRAELLRLGRKQYVRLAREIRANLLGRVTDDHDDRLGSGTARASTTYRIIGWPHTSCKTLALSDFIRFPWPAARMIATGPCIDLPPRKVLESSLHDPRRSTCIR